MTQPRSARGARLWAKPQSQRMRTEGRPGIFQRVAAFGAAAAGPADTAALRSRSATVGEAPVAADAKGRVRRNISTRRGVWTCCGWSCGHSRAPLTERDCGRSPSRSGCEGKGAPEYFNASRRLDLLRLVLRTQPRSSLPPLRFLRPGVF